MRYVESSASPIGCNVGENSCVRGGGGGSGNSTTTVGGGGGGGGGPGAISFGYEVQQQQQRHQLEPKFTCELPEVDDTDPDVIPNQYGE